MDTARSQPVVPVILSGGSGTRLWPMSRGEMPKQFCRLRSDLSLFQETVQRAVQVSTAGPVVVCSESHRFLVERQLEQLAVTPAALILEPVARNTAAAVATAAAFIARDSPSALMLVLPSDHVVTDLTEFAEVVGTAAAAAYAGHLVTFGITPTEPHTGYGYVRRGAPLAGIPRAFGAEQFVEKPDLPTARDYVNEGKWLWNSGMFLLPALTCLAELELYEPAVAAAATTSMDRAVQSGLAHCLDADSFARSPSISLDYALMEHTHLAAVVPAQLGWSDVGAWSSLWEISEKDAAGNVTIGDVVTEQVENSYVQSDGTLVTALGLTDVTIVATKDTVLVADRGHSQQVRDLVEQLRLRQRPEVEAGRVTHRPWGTYESVHRGGRHQVKHIVVEPGGRLSLQRHRHRAEHWVVVSGRAKVERGEDCLTLEVNEQLFVPQGCVHRLENPGDEPLHLIEVQVGDYLGEDDIERIDDAYGRC